MPDQDPKHRLVAVHLDERSIGRGSPDQEHERASAIYDLIEDNWFAPAGGEPGPYVLHILLQEGRLVLDVRDETDDPVATHILSLTPFRRVVRDYFAICES